MARARARGERWRLELPPLEDLYSVQVGIMQVLDALAHEQLDSRRGGLMLYGLQQAATNLRCPQEVWERSCRFDNVEEVRWDGFEEEHGLPKNFDVDTPPEVAFPPAAAERSSSEVAPQERRAEAKQAAKPTQSETPDSPAAAGAPPLSAADAPALSAKCAPSLSASIADRAATEAAKKDPQPAAAETGAVADKIG